MSSPLFGSGLPVPQFVPGIPSGGPFSPRGAEDMPYYRLGAQFLDSSVALGMSGPLVSAAGFVQPVAIVRDVSQADPEQSRTFMFGAKMDSSPGQVAAIEVSAPEDFNLAVFISGFWARGTAGNSRMAMRFLTPSFSPDTAFINSNTMVLNDEGVAYGQAHESQAFSGYRNAGVTAGGHLDYGPAFTLSTEFSTIIPAQANGYGIRIPPGRNFVFGPNGVEAAMAGQGLHAAVWVREINRTGPPQ